jgi:hypothetical protein
MVARSHAGTVPAGGGGMTRSRFTIAVLGLLTWFAGAHDAHAASWKYKYVSTPTGPYKARTKLRAAREKYVASWLKSLGPRPDGVRMIPATNGFHVWARVDKAGYQYKLVHYGKNKWTNPISLKSQIGAGNATFGGFLRVRKSSYDEQYGYRLVRTAGSKKGGGSWAYTHVKAAGPNWKSVVNDFINQQKPNSANSIWGGLSRGKDFHFWVKKGTSSCKWAITNQQLPPSATSLMGGLVKGAIAARKLAPVGFNYSSPQHLWSVNLTNATSCLK